jgi:hypothetical protein
MQTSSILIMILCPFLGINIASQLCGKSSPNWCDFSKVLFYFHLLTFTIYYHYFPTLFLNDGIYQADWYIPQPQLPAAPTFMELPSSMALWSTLISPLAENMQYSMDDYLSTLHGVAVSLDASMLALVNNISLNLLPDDYNPPVYDYAANASEESRNQHKDSDVRMKHLCIYIYIH